MYEIGPKLGWRLEPSALLALGGVDGERIFCKGRTDMDLLAPDFRDGDDDEFDGLGDDYDDYPVSLAHYRKKFPYWGRSRLLPRFRGEGAADGWVDRSCYLLHRDV